MNTQSENSVKVHPFFMTATHSETTTKSLICDFNFQSDNEKEKIS